MQTSRIEHDMRGNIAAFEQTVRSTIALADTFAAADWDRPTDCPGWSVRDVVAHLAAVESMLLGEPVPEHALPDDLPHVRGDMGRLMEVGVDVRRPLPGPEIVDELRALLDRRLAALPGIDPEQETLCPDGRIGPYSRFMMFRAFDCWTHEQDLRCALGRPGNQDAPAAATAWKILGDALPFVVAKRAGAAPGQSAAFEITGPPSPSMYVQVGEDGRGHSVAELPDPAVTLRMDWATFVRLGAGRRTPDEVTVEVRGDSALAARILAELALTP